MSEALFSDKIWNLKSDDIINCLKSLPQFEINQKISLVDLLVNNNICSSKREAREMISGNAISINNKKITEDRIITKDDAIDKKIILLRKGKKNYYLGLFKD